MKKRRSSMEIFGEALIKLARELPVDRITVKQIVETSGLSLQTFYNHFADKEDLIRWLHECGGKWAIARLMEPRYNFHDLTMDNVRFYAANANYLRASMDGGVLNPYAQISVDSAHSFLSAYICQRFGMERLSEELDFYLRMYVAAGIQVLGDWSLNGQKLPPERLARYLEEGMPEALKPYLLD